MLPQVRTAQNECSKMIEVQGGVALCFSWRAGATTARLEGLLPGPCSHSADRLKKKASCERRERRGGGVHACMCGKLWCMHTCVSFVCAYACARHKQWLELFTFLSFSSLSQVCGLAPSGSRHSARGPHAPIVLKPPIPFPQRGPKLVGSEGPNCRQCVRHGRAAQARERLRP